MVINKKLIQTIYQFEWESDKWMQNRVLIKW